MIAVEITNLFDSDIILHTCYQLIVYLQNQIHAVDKHVQISANVKQIFDVEVHDKKRVLQYINQILKFVNVLTLDKSDFSSKMALLDQEKLLQHKKTFRNIIPAILTYIKASTQSSLRNTDRSWNDGLSACYHILDHLLDLLYPDMLLQVVQTLLSEENEVEVRRKIIDLLNKKLDSPEQFADCKESILALLGKNILLQPLAISLFRLLFPQIHSPRSLIPSPKRREIHHFQKMPWLPFNCCPES